jgi:hypothetical protein
MASGGDTPGVFERLAAFLTVGNVRVSQCGAVWILESSDGDAPPSGEDEGHVPHGTLATEADLRRLGGVLVAGTTPPSPGEASSSSGEEEDEDFVPASSDDDTGSATGSATDPPPAPLPVRSTQPVIDLRACGTAHIYIGSRDASSSARDASSATAPTK